MKRRKSIKILAFGFIYFFIPIQRISSMVIYCTEQCKTAWTGLSKFNATRYQFRYIEPTSHLPKVFIYGDSISIGYTEYVRASFNGKADVFRLHVNGGSSDSFISKMDIFRKALFQPNSKECWNFEWDVIHFNVGLHDLKYLNNRKLDKEYGIQVSSLETYKNNLLKIVKYLKKNYPKTQLIFATTTPVPVGEPGRFVGDSKRYNKVALDVMKNFEDIVINDLYKFSVPILKAHAVKLGNVHYTGEGSRLQGIEVAKSIANVMGVEINDCPSASIINEQAMAYEKIHKKN